MKSELINGKKRYFAILSSAMLSLALVGLMATLMTNGKAPKTFAKTGFLEGQDAYYSRSDEATSTEAATTIATAEACGAPVVTLESGLVIEVMNDGWNGGKGRFVKIEGVKTITYIHLGEIFVTEGNMIKKGDPIGVAGRSGLSSNSSCVRETEG